MSLADRLVTRREWGAAAPRSRTALRTPKGNTAHYEGPTMGTFPHAECASRVRGIQAFHMNTRGWADIAYSSVFCGHGSVFEGRWLGVRTAAQGTNEGNATHYAHCFLGGQGDPLTAEARAAFKDILSFFRANGSGPELRPHRFWHSTACPGDPLLGLIEEKLAGPVRLTPSVGPGGVPAAVGFLARPGGGGWIVAGDGGLFSIGTTPFLQSLSGHASDPVVGGAGTPSGQGYWLVDKVGHVFAFGDAQHFGPDAALVLNAPIVGMAGTRNGTGYWLVGADGGVFSFGSAGFIKSLAGHQLNDPIVAIVAGQAAGGRRNRTAPGYLLVGADGGVFPFGTDFFGSMADHPLRAPIVSVAGTPTGDGYWLFAADGGVFAFGDAPFRGVHAALAGEWERGDRRIMGGVFVGDPGQRATWGYELYSDRLPVERYRFVPAPKR